MAETISGGFFDNSYGLRPMVGQDNSFGDLQMLLVLR